MTASLAEMLDSSPYLSYMYAYPHKTAYRPFDPVRSLEDLWRAEDTSALFLYLHIPFCEMRCGFCNLFTTAHPEPGFEAQYLDALWRQAQRVREALGDSTIARMAIGGGTPTFLDPAGLERVLDIASEIFNADLHVIPVSVETSPTTATKDRLCLLRERGVDRISLGIQSFVEAEVRAAGRSQRTEKVEKALDRIRDAGFPTLNVDLIYGLPGQAVSSWIGSLEAALAWAPEEIYLYPLYVRPLTGLGRHDCDWDDMRLACYRAGRDWLLERGYRQVSMRMFKSDRAPATCGTEYCCQDDGMIGLGCGARSYTRDIHYSSEYAVGRVGIQAILEDYVGSTEEQYGVADYGFVLDADEQHRRYIIKSILRSEGLDLAAYSRRFGTDALEDVPLLAEMKARGLLERLNGRLVPSALGLERSDAVGPWLTSARVRRLMGEYELR